MEDDNEFLRHGEERIDGSFMVILLYLGHGIRRVDKFLEEELEILNF